ncbi:MAG: enoyl-CoA hydratase, partial [Gammaproteobacteria bacterium]|nr:enoyl-CoA hydratase [Gammaproteobacteria bacterium]
EITSARENKDSGHAFFRRLFDHCSTLMQLIVNSPQPVIAEVDGIATAAGCQLVASCDLAIASTESKFATPGVNIGLFCSTPMVALSRNVQKKNAMEMLLTGDFINAEKAKEVGLINNVVEKEDLSEEVSILAEKIASKSSMTVSIGKKAFYAQAEMDLSEAYKHTSKIMSDNLLKDDAKEGIDAFIEKRKPDWKDK